MFLTAIGMTFYVLRNSFGYKKIKKFNKNLSICLINPRNAIKYILWVLNPQNVTHRRKTHQMLIEKKPMKVKPKKYL